MKVHKIARKLHKNAQKCMEKILNDIKMHEFYIKVHKNT